MLTDMALERPELGWGYHVPRMLLQPLLIWAATEGHPLALT